jgi:hypothetical protein
MEPKIESRPVSPSPAPAPPALIDAAYCGPDPDFTEIAALFARGGVPL